MSLVAVTGYASLDHVASLDGKPAAGSTTMIVGRPAEWPRLGGGPAYVASALVKSGVSPVYPLSWVGTDRDGEAYCAKLSAAGVATDGIQRRADGRTPLAILAYQPDGGCICLYDTGMPQVLPLSVAQLDIVARADWVCVTIGPKEATVGVLDTIRPAAKLAWVVKYAPTDMPFEHAVRLAGRSDLICFSRAESPFVKEVLSKTPSRPSRILIETRGEEGALLSRDDEERFVAASPISVGDPTGAGDTFAGGALAALVKGETDATKILQAGHAAARQLLLGRQAGETESM